MVKRKVEKRELPEDSRLASLVYLVEMRDLFLNRVESNHFRLSPNFHTCIVAYACLYTHMHECAHVCTHTHMHTHTNTHMHTCTHWILTSLS